MSNLKEELNNYKDKKSSYKYIGLLIVVFVIAILIYIFFPKSLLEFNKAAIINAKKVRIGTIYSQSTKVFFKESQNLSSRNIFA